MGSGINQDNIDDFLKVVDGVIVGSSIKENGIVENPVDLKRTKALFDR
ncbi:MAG: BtpA/SgcQ family protein [Bacillota bacterium]|nr:BtpA/SgcQ family protein [Bacillota bacterium]